MSTLREIIYDIKERLNIFSDDNTFSDEHIAFMIKQKRAKLLKYYISNLRKEVSFDAKQEICLNLELVDCKQDINILESKENLPGIIETTGRNLIQSVNLPGIMSKWINIIGYERLPYLTGGRFNGKQIYITVSPDRKIMLYSLSGTHELIDNIKLSILAEDPEEADKLSCDGSEECDFYDKKFPNEASLNDQIKNEIVQELTIKYRLPVDLMNDAMDNTANAGMQMYGRRPRVQQQEDPRKQQQQEE